MSDFNAMQTQPAETQLSAGTKIEESRAVAEIQAHIISAKRFPRDENKAYENVIQSCKRVSLAESAIYVFSRGGKSISGPSIRLAELLAQKYGNISMEVSITHQDTEKTVGRAKATELETNCTSTAPFVVPHKRTTKSGVKILTDETDIRYSVNSIASRVLRECILRVLPGDLIELAMNQCQKTLEQSNVPLPEQIKSMLEAFKKFGIEKEHIEKRLRHNMDATTRTEIVHLKGIWKSLQDGMAKREDFFDFGGVASNAAESVTNLIAAKTEHKKPETEAEKILHQMLEAKSIETLDIAADLIASITNEDEKKELYRFYKEKKETFVAK